MRKYKIVGFLKLFLLQQGFFQMLIYNSFAVIMAIQEKVVTSFSHINVMNVVTLRVNICMSPFYR